jgi:hypothetical protein
MVGRLGEQSSVAVGVRSPRKSFRYPSQHPSDLARRVHGSGEVGVQIAPEEWILSTLPCILLSLFLSSSAITSSGVPSLSEDAFLRGFSYLRDLVSRDRLFRIPLPGRVMSSNIPAPVPSSTGFSLRRFLPGYSRLVVGDGGRFRPSDEEDVGVERRCRRGDLLPGSWRLRFSGIFGVC